MSTHTQEIAHIEIENLVCWVVLVVPSLCLFKCIVIAAPGLELYAAVVYIP